MPISSLGGSSGGSNTGVEELLGKTLFTEFNEATISSAIESTLVSYTVPSGKKGRLKHVQATGEADAIFRLYIDTDQKTEARNVWTERNFTTTLEIEAIAGETIILKVEHTEPSSKQYQGTLSGYLLTA